MTPEQWISDVTGKPWVDRATGPDGYDCWGLVLDYFRRVHGRELVDIPGYADHGCDFWGGMQYALTNGVIIPAPAESAVIFTRFVGDQATHVGVITGGRVVHALGANDSGGQVYNHTMTHIRRLFSGNRLEFWQCR